MKKINSPFVRPDDREEFPGVGAGETDYIDRQILLEFVQTGTDENGKAIGSIKPVVKETKTNINDVIQSHAEEVGVVNLIALYARTGNEALFAQKTPLPAGDYSVMPDKSPEEIYETLPSELTKGLSYEEFMKSFTAEMFEKFVAELAAKNEPEKVPEVKDNE